MSQSTKLTLQSTGRWIVGNIGWSLLTWIVGGVAGVETILAFAVSHLRTSVWNILRTSPSKWQATEISIVLVLSLTLIVAVFLFGYRLRAGQKQKKVYDFVDVGGFAWRYHVESADMTDTPHCKQHHLPLVLVGHFPDMPGNPMIFACSSCERTQYADADLVERWRDLAKARCHAIVFDYLQEDK